MADTNIYCGFPVKVATEAELQAAAMHGSLVHREAGIAFYSYGNAIYCVEDRMKAALETLAASPSPSALTEEGVTEEMVERALTTFFYRGDSWTSATEKLREGAREQMRAALVAAISPKGGT